VVIARQAPRRAAAARPLRAIDSAAEADADLPLGDVPATLAPLLTVAEDQFIASLAGRSPRTATTYRNALARLHEYLVN
jgi:hypothetical protein